MSKLVTQFISTFNRTEKYLKEYLNSESNFHSLINEASRKSAVVHAHKDKLQHYRKLRNVIVHETRSETYIASPYKSTVEEFEEVYKKISDPPKVYPRCEINVKTFSSNDKLHSVLEDIKNYKYTQFPIYENNKFNKLLTTNGITNALAKMFNLKDGGVILEDDLKIKQILPYEEYEKNYEFISKDYNMYEATEMFNNKENSVEALLITQNGKITENLLGIVTIWDVLKFNNVN